jgi:hypothetical protein
MMDFKYHFLYKTTCLETNKFYIGMHSSNDLSDGYLGSGTILRRSIKKYGANRHIFEILSFYQTRKELEIAESLLVTEDLINTELNINLKPGGNGGSRKGLKRNTEAVSNIRLGNIGKNKGRKFPPRSEIHKQNIRNGRVKKIPWNKGIKLTDEQKKSSLSEEHKIRISNSLKNYFASLAKRSKATAS